ncbi:MAG: ABC transporter permease [Gammaproteobacteria bacterium]
MSGSFRRLWAVATKETVQLRRDRLTFGMIVGLPILLIMLFGYAINFDVRGLHTAVLDAAGSSMSRELMAQLEATQVVTVVAYPRGDLELAQLMRSGEVTVGIVIPEDFERRLQSTSRPVVQILVDGSQPTLSNVVERLATVPILMRHGVDANRLQVRRISVQTLFNPERRTAVQVVPALIGVILSMTMVIFTAGAIVREREHGNLELLITTPLGRSELMIGKLLPYVAIGLLQTTLVLVVGSLLFDVPVIGSLFAFYVAALMFIAATLAMGLFVSTLAQTQFQSFQLAYITILPSILLSGFMFPFDGMPKFAQGIAQFLPLTHFNVMVRGILLRGAALVDLWVPAVKLTAFFIVMMIVAVMRFKKRLD